MDERVNTMAPGMSRVVFAGEKVVITDSEGNDIQLDCRESNEVMDFLRGFLVYTNMVRDNAPGVQLQWQRVIMLFNGLPSRVQREVLLPSRLPSV